MRYLRELTPMERMRLYEEAVKLRCLVHKLLEHSSISY